MVGGEEDHQHVAVVEVGQAVNLIVDADQGEVGGRIADLQILHAFLGADEMSDQKQRTNNQQSGQTFHGFKGVGVASTLAPNGSPVNPDRTPARRGVHTR